ncbi:MAG: YCII-related [Candidatus Acidoferrum typicum]|nr:YCII-related [Candidatus Acidoferrum typicum]
MMTRLKREFCGGRRRRLPNPRWKRQPSRHGRSGIVGGPFTNLVKACQEYFQEKRCERTLSISLALAKAGVLLAAEGLRPTSKGMRLRMSKGKRVVTDGPFTEAKEVIAGFWMIQVKSKEEALEWANPCLLPEGGLMEIRQVFENCDFPPELQKKTADP